MKLSRLHRGLNLFEHFGGDYANENNTTRAFLIALCRSPWSPTLLRGFFDLVRDNIAKEHGASLHRYEPFLSRWPVEVEFDMQKDVRPDTMSSVGIEGIVLVELTPTAGPLEVSSGSGPESDARSIADAKLHVTGADDRGVLIIIESKLYGRAGTYQIERYKRWLGPEKTVHVSIAWEEVYRLTELLPEESLFDPILADFKAYLDRDPRLVGFTGFRSADFSNVPTLIERLHRLCERLVADDGNTVLYGAEPEQVRGEPDFNIHLRERGDLCGNIGVASWSEASIDSKLVIGSKTHWEMYRLLQGAWELPAVAEQLRQLDPDRLTIDAHVRLRFPWAVRNRGYPWVALRRWEPGSEVLDRWREAVEFARAFYRKDATLDILGQIASLPVMNDHAAIEQARGLNRESGLATSYVVFVLYLSRRGEPFLRRDAASQVRDVSQDVTAIGKLLLALSGRPE